MGTPAMELAWSLRGASQQNLYVGVPGCEIPTPARGGGRGWDTSLSLATIAHACPLGPSPLMQGGVSATGSYRPSSTTAHHPPA